MNKNSSYHPMIAAFWFLLLLTSLVRFKPQVWQKQVFIGRNTTLTATNANTDFKVCYHHGWKSSAGPGGCQSLC